MTGGLELDVAVRRGDLDLRATLDVASSERVAVVGPNGAGKTTLLDVIGGLVAVDRGRVVLGGVVLDDGASNFVEPERREISRLFQDRMLFAHLTVLDNVAFGLRARGAKRATARSTAMSWLDRLGVADLAAMRPTTLSGGQQQRVALARALAGSPRAILLDEPLSALDATSRHDMSQALREHLADRSVPVVLVTHDPVEAMAFADRIVVLEGGRITQIDVPLGLRTRPATPWIADLVGVNLFSGRAQGTSVLLDNGHELAVGAVHHGPVDVTIHPRAITLHGTPPQGSARNVWPTVVVDVVEVDDRVRVVVGGPVPLVAEITAAARAELAIVPGASIIVSCKATELHVVAR